MEELPDCRLQSGLSTENLMPSQHDVAARRIARKYGAEYVPGQRPDIQTQEMIIEVETVETMTDGIRQLQKYRKPVYVAGTNDIAIESALAAPHDRTVGVMDQYGNIRRNSTRA